jgi:hypothetical protein
MAKKVKPIVSDSYELLIKFKANEIDLENLLSNDEIYSKLLIHIYEFLLRDKPNQIEALQDAMNIVKQKYITSTKSIQDAILEAVEIAITDYDNWESELPSGLAKLIDFLKYQITYIPNHGDQIIKLPYRFLLDKEGDCKSFAVIFSAYCTINNIPNGLLFTSYENDREITHVYNYIIEDSKIVEVDLTLPKPLQTIKKFTLKEYYSILN